MEISIIYQKKIHINTNVNTNFDIELVWENLPDGNYGTSELDGSSGYFISLFISEYSDSNYENFLKSTESHHLVSSWTVGAICFLGGEKVETDQGKIRFDKLTLKNTINNKKIKKITKVTNSDNSIIFIHKHALGKNIPNRNTYVGRNHGIYIDNQTIKKLGLYYQTHPIIPQIEGKKLVRARNLVNIKNVFEIKRRYDTLYNILLEEASTMIVNGMLCETLNPNDTMVKKLVL